MQVANAGHISAKSALHSRDIGTAALPIDAKPRREK